VFVWMCYWSHQQNFQLPESPKKWPRGNSNCSEIAGSEFCLLKLLYVSFFALYKWLFGTPYIRCSYFLTDSIEIYVMRNQRVSVTTPQCPKQMQSNEATSNKRYVNLKVLSVAHLGWQSLL